MEKSSQTGQTQKNKETGLIVLIAVIAAAAVAAAVIIAMSHNRKEPAPDAAEPTANEQMVADDENPVTGEGGDPGEDAVLKDDGNNVVYGDEDLGIDAAVDEALKDYRNIVIYGLDARDIDSSRGHRSDAMLILSVNRKTDAVKLFSVYRDTYLQIDDEGRLDKTNHAYAFGGMQQSLKTLNRNLDLNIREAVTFNWKAMQDLVDALGGIDMDIQENEIPFINRHLKGMDAEDEYITADGVQRLSGIQAVAYSRIRYDSSDFKRNERMQNVLITSFKKAQGMDAGQLMSIMDGLVDEIDSNMSLGTMTETLAQIKNLNIDENMGFPFEKHGWMHNKIYYCVPVTLASNVTELHERIFGQSGYTPTQFVQDVSGQIESVSGYSK